MSFCSRVREASRRCVSVVPMTALVAGLMLLSGCDKDGDQRIEASYSEMRTSRPAELVQAYSELQGGQASQAYSTAQAYLDANPQSPYRPEAFYITGQALAAQGQYGQGKDRLDVAISKTNDRSLKALAMLGRADCNMGLGRYHLASEQYHWIELNFKEVRVLQQDEVMFKLGMAAKKCKNTDWADYWFNQVNELYHRGPYAERARQESSKFTPTGAHEKPLVYYLEAYEFTKAEKAEESAATLRSKGYRDVEVVPATRNYERVYEVHVGKFTSRAEAGRAQVDANLAGLSTTLRPGAIEPK